MVKITKLDEFNQEDYITYKVGKTIISLPRGSFEIYCGNNCSIVCGNNCKIDCGDNCKISCGGNDCEITSGNNCKIYCGDNCEIRAFKGTEVVSVVVRDYVYQFKERKTIKVHNEKFEEVKE